MERIYLDYAASTPVDKRVLDAMKPYFMDNFGNPGSIHYFGQRAMAAIDKSRETIAKILGANFREIVFTSSATEANNLVIKGSISKSKIKNPKIITSQIEHESVIETCKDLEKRGIEVVYVPVSKKGIVDLKTLEKELDERTVLVSIIMASNEIGTIQPIKEITDIIKNFKKEKKYPLFHTDAVQAMQFMNLDVMDFGIDAMTLSSQKIYGPKGAACLYLRNKEMFSGETTGGIQEFNLRAGTENVPAIVGFAKAAEIIEKNKEAESKRIEALRNYFWTKLKLAKPNLVLNGDIKKRLPNNLNIYFPKNYSEDLLIQLDMAGVCVSLGSACAGRTEEPSYIVQALGFGKDRAKRSLRITLGRPTKKNQVDKAVKQIINLMK